MNSVKDFFPSAERLHEYDNDSPLTFDPTSGLSIKPEYRELKKPMSPETKEHMVNALGTGAAAAGFGLTARHYAKQLGSQHRLPATALMPSPSHTAVGLLGAGSYLIGRQEANDKLTGIGAALTAGAAAHSMYTTHKNLMKSNPAYAGSSEAKNKLLAAALYAVPGMLLAGETIHQLTSAVKPKPKKEEEY